MAKTFSSSEWIPAGAVYYHNAFAVIFDPEGGHHVCYELSEEYPGQGPRVWCAGYVRRDAADVTEALWANWDKPCVWDRSYERAERAVTERMG